MASYSFCYGSINGDRRYRAQMFKKYFASFIGNGVFPNPSSNLQVMAETDDMNVTVKQGAAWINGAYMYTDSDTVFKLDAADGALSRIDLIVVRSDESTRDMFLTVKKGALAVNPVEPELQRDGEAYEICLAKVHVNKGAIAITQVNVTDTRESSELCGYVHGVVDQVDTETIYNQYELWYEQTIATWEEWWNNQQDRDGYLTVAGTNPILSTTDKTVLGAINELAATGWYDLVASGAGAHNSIYRGKNLGSEVTDEQYAAISSGTFEDLYIGDYWTIGGVNYRIAAFDYFYNVGNTALTTHHAVIVPDTILYNATMNATNITTGGYTGSVMYTTNLTQAKTTIKAAFLNHVLKHSELLTNAVNASGQASGWEWFDSEVELMNEVMVYGSVVAGASMYNVASSHGVLPLFAIRHDLVNNRESYWLRDVCSALTFAQVSSAGYAGSGGASHSLGVRPAFCIS